MYRAVGVSAFLILFSITSTVEAQIVRVGPFGGVRIRAPFFGMDVPPYFAPPIPPAPVAVVPAYPYPVPAYPVPRYAYPPLPSVRIEYAAPAVVQPVPVQPYSTARPNWTPPADMAELERQLWESATRLVRGLSVRRDGDIWANYLKPDRILAVIEQGSGRETLAELTKHYDGVAGNPQLAWLRNVDGFAATRSLLHQYVAAPANVAAPSATSPQPAPPTQEPTPDPVPAESNLGPAKADPVPLPAPAPDPIPADDPPEKDVPTPATPIKAADAGDFLDS